MGPVHASSSRPSSSKPYDRLPHSPKPNAKPSHLGLPSQLSQTSRKGKRAWRKNIDVSAIEEALESAREEERITG
jgi:nucleolar protein 53